MSLPVATRWRWLLVALIATGLGGALAPLGGHTGPQDWLLGADKLVHFAYFALLWWVAVRAQGLRAWPLGLHLLCFGVGIELAQGILTATREASLGDVVADAAGLLLGAALTGAASVGQPKEHRR